MTRAVIIGIDGLDADLLRVYGPSLPHLRRLMLESPFLELKASFPPENASAWASIYSGLNPGNHGILEGGRNFNNARTMPDTKTFWEIALRAGKQVCIVNPRLSFTDNADNQEQAEVHSLPPLEIKGNLHQLGDLCDSLRRVTEEQVERGLDYFQHAAWDIFYLQLDALDYVQHLLWRYSDPGDPLYPGRNKHGGRILDFYHLFDQITGRFRSLIEPDCVLLVVSSHGHGRSCTVCFNVNEWLREQGLLVPSAKSRLLNRHYLVERTRHHSARLRPIQIQDVMPHIKGTAAGQPTQYPLAHVIDEQATMAQVVTLLGTSTSPFGGIILNREAIESKGKTYEEVRESVLQGLTQVRVKGNLAVSWADRREHIYRGPYSQMYPDILFELRGNFGTGNDLFVPMFTGNAKHAIVSGAHRMYGVCLFGNLPVEVKVMEATGEATAIDVAPTILNLIGVETASASHDGQALIFHDPATQSSVHSFAVVTSQREQ
jgi:predicted AlkP superfamily phosphohydrolase/phosphomutase